MFCVILRFPEISGRSRGGLTQARLPLPLHLRLETPHGRGLRGAALVTTDMTLEKSFELTERMRFDLRGEIYNLLNHANCNVPGATFGAADFGVVTSARPGRTVQLAARLSF